MNDCMKKFFSFLQIKNKMEALHDDRTIFWAFETSAAIKASEQKTISRFVETQPIIIGTNINDVRQRSRFIWTNITILQDNIEQYTNQQIYLHKLPKYAGKRVKYNEDHKDMPWCYTSVYVILSNFIKNNVHRCK
uniref:DNA (Cytosine-5)-methyltransferase 3A n=1 Tax=Schizaphis graminum TaxID=13262 RepID=A0A2S2NG12_SCHGA